jgi:hypothetical protein
MSDQILFDKLRYIDRLKGAGVADEQARAHADAIDDALREVVATKRDLDALAAATKHDLDAARAALESKIDIAVRDMTIRSGALAAAIVGILATIKYFG